MYFYIENTSLKIRLKTRLKEYMKGLLWILPLLRSPRMIAQPLFQFPALKQLVPVRQVVGYRYQSSLHPDYSLAMHTESPSGTHKVSTDELVLSLINKLFAHRGCRFCGFCSNTPRGDLPPWNSHKQWKAQGTCRTACPAQPVWRKPMRRTVDGPPVLHCPLWRKRMRATT